ncbi:hypothetical protein A3A71_00190 [Candidatus Berkelbacteria bacterium RIFCSPLOWO2_01_FULL_50_28]|uniref:HTH cro/C1-type domain-containing protein n=1 Tax=Candidatus Berkelbacteria bacterium RIFCSPLOWO2_01_FULL_50_28 TaxID=1797471 RepID=A0A1F5EAZ0_9BACT|nr:MAG: hypothetical protein A2807_00120 [Candidatus Berkelbacteria bacterium RIFCSPHIGHO2_01_FULL_50_36]OGD62816.1 MAG: hypothetical protein A3F39_02185 [Candidatus Berkelbacteria bacterium RIFCSPHIGHO2_12_FULL_50_11]OGD64470.1 MAG: hypothetical protein A3A71_00190 [Candidatus Berkelbacteria bacterium RIFCSPLOWO2_01_FULL_50_28]
MRRLSRDFNREKFLKDQEEKRYITETIGGPKKAFNKRRRLNPGAPKIRIPEPVLEAIWFKELCGVLAHKRRERGLSQLELANIVKTTQTAISRLECARANPTSEFLDRVYEALKLNISFHITDHVSK